MKSNLLGKVLFYVFMVFGQYGTAQGDEAENREWKSLFNGSYLEGSTTKIHHYDVGDNHGQTFRVFDSTLQVRYDKYEGISTTTLGGFTTIRPIPIFTNRLSTAFLGNPVPEHLHLL